MRLRSIRYKDGRAPIHILRTLEPDDELQGVIRRHAATIADLSEPDSELTGFFMVGMFSDGRTSVGLRIPEHIPRALLTAYLNEIVRRDVIIDNEARDVFDSMFQWEEG